MTNPAPMSCDMSSSSLLGGAAPAGGEQSRQPFIHRGKDSTGSEVWVCGDLRITRHPNQGVCLWRGKELASIGFNSVDAAKRYAERVFHAVAD